MKIATVVFIFAFMWIPTFSVPIGDYLWCDTILNGVQDPNEYGLAGITVWLTDANGTVLANTTTDVNGRYTFNVTALGTYFLRVNIGENSDLVVQPTLLKQGPDNSTNSKALYTTVNGTQYAIAEFVIDANTTEIMNVDFGFDCINCRLTTYLFDATNVAGLNSQSRDWHGHNDDHSFSQLADAGAVMEISVNDQGRMACINLNPLGRVTVGQVDFFSFKSTKFNSTTLEVTLGTSQGQSILSNISLQNYTSGNACSGRSNSCQSFPISMMNPYPQAAGDVEVCISCGAELNPAPIKICLMGVRAQQFADVTIKAHIRNVIGYGSENEVDVVGILPAQCEYLSPFVWNNHKWNNDDDSWHNWEDDDEHWSDDDSNWDDREYEDDDDDSPRKKHDDDDDDGSPSWDDDGDGTEIVVVVRN